MKADCVRSRIGSNHAGEQSGSCRERGRIKSGHAEEPSRLYRDREWIRGIGVGCLISVGIAWLFYRSVWALLLGAVVIPFCVRRRAQRRRERSARQLEKQFQSGMQAVSAALLAGYSMENAWCSAQTEVEKLYGTDSVMAAELRRMNQRVRMNEALEVLLMEFARRSDNEDIRNFAEILQYAKRSGGNMTAIIRTTVERMQEKAEVLEEIENAVAAKKWEQKLMMILFPGVLLFVTLGSPEYVSCLYHTVLGVPVMSGCLAGYVGACLWAERLTDIRV